MMKEALAPQTPEIQSLEPEPMILQEGRFHRHLQIEKDQRLSFNRTDDTGPFAVTDLLHGTSYQVTLAGSYCELRLPIEHGSIVAPVEVGTDLVDLAERLMQCPNPLASQG